MIEKYVQGKKKKEQAAQKKEQAARQQKQLARRPVDPPVESGLAVHDVKSTKESEALTQRPLDKQHELKQGANMMEIMEQLKKAQEFLGLAGPGAGPGAPAVFNSSPPRVTYDPQIPGSFESYSAPTSHVPMSSLLSGLGPSTGHLVACGGCGERNLVGFFFCSFCGRKSTSTEKVLCFVGRIVSHV